MFDTAKEEVKEEARRELDDIFSKTGADAAPAETKPAVFQPKAAVATPAVPVAGPNRFHKLLVPLAAIIGLALALAGGYYGYRYVMGRFLGWDAAPAPEEAAAPAPDAASTPAPEEAAAPEVQQSQDGLGTAAAETDTDADGLTDAEEAIIGTNGQTVDTDGDGLFDREEAKVYKTDPLDPDTDNDGFVDGSEVRDGYNPNGPGRLYEIKDQ